MLLKEQNRGTRPVSEKLDPVLETESDCEAATNEGNTAVPDRKEGNHGEDKRDSSGRCRAHIAQELGKHATGEVISLNPLTNSDIAGKAVVDSRPHRHSDRTAKQCQPDCNEPGANA